MSTTAVYEDFLHRLEYDFEVDKGNDAIDILLETRWGEEYTIALVPARHAYRLFVSPLVEIGEGCDVEVLYRRLLEISDQTRYVKMTLDSDGDITIAAEGFTRLDKFGQFRRRLEEIVAAIDKYGHEISDLAQNDLF